MGRPCEEEQNAVGCFKMVPFLPSPVRSTRGFFVLCENLVEISEVKPKNCGDPFMDCVSLKFLTLRAVQTKLPAVHQLQLNFPDPGTSSCSSSYSKLCFSVLVCHYLHFGGSSLFLLPSLTYQERLVMFWFVHFFTCY